MFATAEFWVLVAFVGFIALIGKKAYLQITQSLDDRSQKIQRQIHHAESLLDKAQTMLATYQQKHEDAVDQSEEIIAHSEREAMELQASSERELQHQMQLREESCLSRISQAEQDAKDALKTHLAEEAFEIVEKALKDNVKEEESFTKRAIKEIEEVGLQVKS